MLKVNYTIEALQPLHTSSDESFGTERSFRREKVLLPKPIKIKSHFSNDRERRQAIVTILHNIWRNIDWETVRGKRVMTIYDEFSNKLLAATTVRTKEEFLNKLCQKWGIHSLNDLDILEIMDKFSNDELLHSIRQEHQYLVLMLRKAIKEKDVVKTNDESIVSGDDSINFEKHFDTVPFIPGNSIRGLMRRLVMKDFCELAGIRQIEKNMYHQLFTGGNLTESTGFEDIDKREQYVMMCPMIGLLGSAIGNMTIQGEMKVGGARLRCSENGTGDKSYWEFLDISFSTRLDSSKTEKDLSIRNATGEEKSQMKYETEVLVKGSVLDSVFALITTNDLLVSAFWRALKVLKDHAYLVGQSAKDHGLVNIHIDIPANGDHLYLDYLKKNKKAIHGYFSATLEKA